MNRFLYNLEKKLGKYAIPNLTLMLIMCYAVGYLIQMINPQFLYYIQLNPERILHGQVWRILSWLVVPPRQTGLIWVLIMLLFYYQIGKQLEMVWGTFYYNVYVFSGIMINVIGSMLIYLVLYLVMGASGNANLAASIGYTIGMYVSTYYINMTLFLAFATTFPDSEVMLYFVLPIKVKWLGFVYAGLIVLEIVSSGSLVHALIILLSMLNFIIFFFSTKKSMHLNKAQRATRANFRRTTGMGSSPFHRTQSSSQGRSSRPQMHPNGNPGGITRHKCAICGQTEETAPNMSFRFCSKCNGNYEYCENHIFTHTHVK